MITKYRWLDIIEEKQVGKTRRFAVKNSKNGGLIGWIRWYGPFRGYAFLPCEGTAYEEDCLRDLAECVEGLTKAHKDSKFATVPAPRQEELDAVGNQLAEAGEEFLTGMSGGEFVEDEDA